MSTDQLSFIEKKIETFLHDQTPIVVCLRGKWGTGKTTLWKRVTSKQRSGTPYSYVSLFGLNSIDELKKAIFAGFGMDQAPRRGKKSVISFGIKQLSELAVTIGNAAPGWWKIAGLVIETLYFETIHDVVICLDDIERRGSNLTIREILGLVTHLRDDRSCRVMLVLNDDALDNVEDLADYERLSEKSIDQSFCFDPQPQWCFNIANTSANDSLVLRNDLLIKVRELVCTLEIKNIRVLRKIVMHCAHLKQVLAEYQPQVADQAYTAAVLLTWCFLVPGDAPSLKFIKSRTVNVWLMRETEGLSEAEKIWNAQLSSISFGNLDEFDKEILLGIEAGYFNDEKLKLQANLLDRQAKDGHSQEALRSGWEPLRNSLENNLNEVLGSIEKATLENLSSANLSDIDAAVCAMRRFKLNDRAQKLGYAFINQPDRPREFFDISTYQHVFDVTDPELKAMIEGKYASFPDDRTPFQALSHLATGSFSVRDIEFLSNISAEGFYDLFKSLKSPELGVALTGATHFRSSPDAHKRMPIFLKNVTEALVRIAKESEINAWRLEPYKLIATRQDQEALGPASNL